MWYTPTTAKNKPLPDRRGQQFGPFVLTHTEDGWQLDHWPTGYRVLPSSAFPFEHPGYRRLRRIAFRLQHEPAFREITSNTPAHAEPRTRAKAALTRILSEV